MNYEQQHSLPVPPLNVLNACSDLILPLINKQGVIHVTNIELIKLRDWLLPMLINGQATLE